MCNIPYYSSMLPVCLLVWYSWNIRSILLRYCRDIVPISKEISLTNLGTILATLYQIWMQSSNPRRSYCAFNIWPNDLQDLEHCVTCCARQWDDFHKVWPSTTYPSWIIAFYDDVSLCHAVTFTFNLLTLNFYSTSGVRCLSSVQNLGEIE